MLGFSVESFDKYSSYKLQNHNKFTLFESVFLVTVFFCYGLQIQRQKILKLDNVERKHDLNIN